MAKVQKFTVKNHGAGRRAVGDGLYLEVKMPDTDPTKKGARKTEGRYWLYRYNSGGKVRWRGLGPYPRVSLAMAREETKRLNHAIYRGENPFAAQVVVPTFAEAVEAFLAVNEKGWQSEKHRAQWRMTLGNAYCASIRTLPVSDIEGHHVLEVLSPIWHDKSETSRRLRGRIENVLDFAKAKGWRSGENPARWRGNLNGALKVVKPVVKHHTALPFERVPAFMAALRSKQSMSATCLAFIILTAARSGEAINATWAEFDLEQATWAVPASRMKSKRKHVVPLSKPALAIVRALYETRTDDHVFPGLVRGRPITAAALTKLVKPEAVTIHGMRSAFRDWAGDHTSFPREVAEAALAHAVGDATERAYRRGDALDKRRKLMDEWANYIDAGPERGKVIAFPA